MVYKAKRVSLVENRTYYTILMQDDEGDMVLWNRKNNRGDNLFTTSLMEAKRFATKEQALNYLYEELKGSRDSTYKIVPVRIEISIKDSSNTI